MTELSDAEVFGTAGAGEMSDADVFGTAPPKRRPADVAGLTDRAVVQALPQGVLGLPGLLLDANDSAINLGKLIYNAAAPVINKVAGTNLEQSTPIPPWQHSAALAEASSRLADMFGLPRPEGKFQTGATKIGTAALSALTGAGLARGLGAGLQAAPQAVQALPSIPTSITERISAAVPSVLEALAASPKMQAAGAATSALAPGLAQEAGIKNPLALTAIGMTAGALPGGFATAGERVAGGAAQSVRPFTNAGREVIVGKALNRIALNPGQAQENLAAAREIVPGSMPMVSQVSRDPGLIGAETALRGMDERNMIGGRYSEQNAARMNELDRIARDEDTLTQATNKRNRAFTDIAVPAFNGAQPVPIGREWINNPILRTIQNLRENPENAGQTTREALDEAQALLTQDNVDITNPRALYAIRKDLALIRDGELSGPGRSGSERGNMRHARSQLSAVIDSLDDTIEQGAPGYRDYMQLFAKRSVPLDQLRALQTLRSRAVLATSDPVTGQPVLSNAKFQTLLRNNMDAGLNLRGRGPDGAKLSTNQLATLDRVAADLDRGSAVTAGTMRSPGSDTFKNLSVAAVIGRVLGDDAGAHVMDTAAAKTIARPLNFLYRVPDQEIQHLMLQAWLDPRLASRLMQRANDENIRSVAADLAERARANAIGASLHGAAAE